MMEEKKKESKFLNIFLNRKKSQRDSGGEQSQHSHNNSNNDLSSRRHQGIFKSLQKKWNSHRNSKSNKQRVVASDPVLVGFAPSISVDENNQNHINTGPPVIPRRTIILNPSDLYNDDDDDDDDISQYLDMSELNQSKCSNVGHPNNSESNSLGTEQIKLAKFGWFWGPLTKPEAEAKLHDLPDGSFLVRDSSSSRHIFTISFRSYGHTMHSHIEYRPGQFSIGDELSRASVSDLIEEAIRISKESVFCYSRGRDEAEPSYPVRFMRPVSRFMEVRSLQYLCRFTIRQYINVGNIQKLPLPSSVKGYLQQGQY